MKVFAKLSVNDESCTNHFIQYGGIEALQGSQDGAQKLLTELQKRRDVLAGKLREIEGISLFIPNSTFYLFPDVTELYHQMLEEEIRTQKKHVFKNKKRTYYKNNFQPTIRIPEEIFIPDYYINDLV